MTESKLDKAQKLLQCIYDFEANPPTAELETELEAKRKEAEEAEIERYGAVRSTWDSFGGGHFYDDERKIRGDALMRSALRTGLSVEDVNVAGNWLRSRKLIDGGGLFNPTDFRLTTLGEDLIDLGVSVAEWYQGPYREKILTPLPTISRTEDEEQ